MFSQLSELVSSVVDMADVDDDGDDDDDSGAGSLLGALSLGGNDDDDDDDDPDDKTKAKKRQLESRRGGHDDDDDDAVDTRMMHGELERDDNYRFPLYSDDDDETSMTGDESYDAEYEYRVQRVNYLDREPLDIFVCGLPGSGRTEMMHRLRETFASKKIPVNVIDKPNLSIIKTQNGTANLTELRAKSPKKNSMLYHINSISQRISKYVVCKQPHTRFTLIESCPHEEIGVLIPASRQLENLSEIEEWTLVNSIMPIIATQLNDKKVFWEYKLFIYLNATPETCARRTQKKRRDADASRHASSSSTTPSNARVAAGDDEPSQEDIDRAEVPYTLDELKVLATHYHKMFVGKSKFMRRHVVLSVSVDRDMDLQGDEYASLVDEIMQNIALAVRQRREKMIRKYGYEALVEHLVRHNQSFPLSTPSVKEETDGDKSLVVEAPPSSSSSSSAATARHQTTVDDSSDSDTKSKFE